MNHHLVKNSNLKNYELFVKKKYKFNVINIGKQMTTDAMTDYFEKAIKESPELYGWEYKKFRRIEENKDLYNF